MSSRPHSVPRLRKLKHHIKYIGLDNPFPKARAPVFLPFIHITQADQMEKPVEYPVSISVGLGQCRESPRVLPGVEICMPPFIAVVVQQP